MVICWPHTEPHLEVLHCKKCSFSWGDLDTVIEMGIPGRTIDVSSLHAVVGSHLAEELREFAVLFTFSGEESNGLRCGVLTQYSLSLNTHPSAYFLMGNIRRGLD